MGLHINTNVSALNVNRSLDRSTRELTRSLERLSSGLHINRAAVDADGLAIAEGFRMQVRGTLAAQRNAQADNSLGQTAVGALGETTTILQRIRELSIQSAIGTQTAVDRNALNTEVQELITHVAGIALDTPFNGINVLSASQSTPLQSGATTSPTLPESVLRARSSDLRLSAVSVSRVAGATAAISLVDDALRAYQNRLEFTANILAIQEENAVAAESAIRDADIARETIQFTRNQILVNAGVNVLAQSNVVSESALNLLST